MVQIYIFKKYSGTFFKNSQQNYLYVIQSYQNCNKKLTFKQLCYYFRDEISIYLFCLSKEISFYIFVKI